MIVILLILGVLILTPLKIFRAHLIQRHTYLDFTHICKWYKLIKQFQLMV
jgi:hypothetical protein